MVNLEPVMDDGSAGPPAAPSSARWRRRPPGSNWGEFGPDDQLGRLNLLTPAKLLQGIAEVREGKAFCLSLPLDYPGGNFLSPSRHPPALRPTVINDRPRLNYHVSQDRPNATDIISDDLVVLHTQYSTQWDSLAHVGHMFDVDGDGVPKAVYYNGFRAGEDVVGPREVEDAGIPDGRSAGRATSSAKSLGIERMAETCVQGRGVMIDLFAHFGRRCVSVTYEMLLDVIRRDGVEIEAGDIVCLHTGFAEMLLEMDRTPDPWRIHHSCASLDGRDGKLLEWITSAGIAALVADNFAVETIPAGAVDEAACFSAAPLHEHCLFKIGVHLGELWHLTPLATWLRKSERYRFLLTAPPLRLPGAVGSPVTPVATV
jgi:kynurenine formamidase